jgi:hypothetical protein
MKKPQEIECKIKENSKDEVRSLPCVLLQQDKATDLGKETAGRKERPPGRFSLSFLHVLHFPLSFSVWFNFQWVFFSFYRFHSLPFYAAYFNQGSSSFSFSFFFFFKESVFHFCPLFFTFYFLLSP